MRARARRLALRLSRLDRRLLAVAVRARSPVTDRIMIAASTVANRSVLWTGVAGVLAATGRRRPRNAASSGLLGIGVAATLVNGPLKFAWRRARPGPTLEDVVPLLPLPRTFSFPSGHSASAFAFGTGVSVALPAAAPVVLPMATTVAYSRVHTGVHYPSDVAVGAAVGTVSGVVAARLVALLRARGARRPAAPVLDRAVPRQLVLVTAPDSGSAEQLDAARSALTEHGWRIEAELAVDDLDRLATFVQRIDPPLVVAAGGDGTVGATADALVGSQAVLAVLPLGTSNDVARSLGLPTDPAEAAAALAAGHVGGIDGAQLRIGGSRPRTFVNAATVGLNVAFAKAATDHSLRARFGGLTYPIAAARALRSYQPFRCTIEHDDGVATYSAVHLSVSNAPVFGGVLGMRVPGASMTDGLLDVIVIERLSLTRLALAVAETIVGQHRPVHRVHTLRVRTLRVTSPDPQEITLDGEVVGRLPAEFRALPGALQVLLPPP